MNTSHLASKPLHEHDIETLSQGLQQNQISPSELTEHFLGRIETLEPKLNALISYTPDLARAAIKRLSPLGENPSPLWGLPILHKDIFCTKGVKTSCGSKMLDNFVAPYDATAVSLLQEAGALTMGKANMDEFAMGSSGRFSFYGPTANPWDLQKVAGGSSSGSASAMAARLAVATTGTDTGGSIRLPAAYTGTTGFKPTYGRISRYGVVAFASSLDTIGFFAKNAKDVAYLMNASAKPCNKDSTSAQKPSENYIQALQNFSLKGVKIGALDLKSFAKSDKEKAVVACFEEALKTYERLGAIIVPVELPVFEIGIPTYYIIACAEASANLSRFDGVRYGYRSNSADDIETLYGQSRAEGFGMEVKRRILTGTYALSSESYEALYMKALQCRYLTKHELEKTFQEVDLIATPTSLQTAPAIQNQDPDPTKAYWEDFFTVQANLSGTPAISHPMGLLEGMPLGMQLMAPMFQDSLVLGATHVFQQATDHHLASPL